MLKDLIYARNVVVFGDYACVADAQAGLKVINIRDSIRPRIVASIDTPGEAYRVHIAGDHAYVADGSCPIALSSKLIGGACFFQILAHFDLPVLSKLRWLGAFNPHNKVSQHKCDFLTV
jgi:hypothetical protein